MGFDIVWMGYDTMWMGKPWISSASDPGYPSNLIGAHLSLTVPMTAVRIRPVELHYVILVP